MKLAQKLLLVFAFTSISLSTFASTLFYTGEGFTTQGKSDFISSDNGFVFANENNRNFIGFSISDWQNNPDFGNAQFFSLSFSAPSGEDLQVGTYLNAVRPYNYNVPNLNFDANGRGHNQLTGSFTILELVFATDNKLLSVAVDFFQNGEDGTLDKSYGSLRHNSSIPLTTYFETPLPSSLALFLSGMGVLFESSRRRKFMIQS